LTGFFGNRKIFCTEKIGSVTKRWALKVDFSPKKGFFLLIERNYDFSLMINHALVRFHRQEWNGLTELYFFSFAAIKH
jgi:hypothetical protein